MNRNKINIKATLIFFGALFASAALIGLVLYWQSFKTVHFDFKQSNVNAVIYKGEQRVAALNSTGDIRLQTGDYSFVPEGDKFDRTAISFKVVEDNTTITVNPPYSESYKNQLLDKELPRITPVIESTYSELFSEFIVGSSRFAISRGYIYKDGEWYGTTLTEIPSTPEQGDIYRLILKKEDGHWVIKTKPAIVLGSHDYPDIPADILSDLNTKQGD